jgi:biopolymer transport protein ExbD
MTAHASPNRELNVTPMLDVLLVLLIIFMAAMQTRKAMEVVLPQPCAGECTGGEHIVLEVLPGPSYRVNSRDVAATDLAAYLTSAYRGRPTRIIQVAGDRKVSYAQVMTAMDIARSAGVEVISISPSSTSR